MTTVAIILAASLAPALIACGAFLLVWSLSGQHDERLADLTHRHDERLASLTEQHAQALASLSKQHDERLANVMDRIQAPAASQIAAIEAAMPRRETPTAPEPIPVLMDGDLQLAAMFDPPGGQ